jgi:preprotein translocase subunit SecG
MQTVLTIIHVFVCVFMILVILLQPSKADGMGGFGGGTSSSVFGGRGSATFLGKVTTVCAAVFMMTALSLAYLSSRTESAVLRSESSKPAPAKTTDQAKPATGATATPAPGPGAAAPAAPAAPAAKAPAPSAPAPAAPAGK